jgi:transcriptional regulator with XRE-family HTH domain
MIETAPMPAEGKAIRLALLVRGWSQEYLAELTGISTTRLSRCLNGVHRFRADELRQVWLHLSSEDSRP